MFMVDGLLTNKDNQKIEAIERMERLNVVSEAIIKFKADGELTCSENGKLIAVPDFIIEEINKEYEEYMNLVYHVVHSGIYGFDIYNCLSVSPYLEDWGYENDLIKMNRSMSYCINLTKPDYTESGSILLKNVDGYLYRIG